MKKEKKSANIKLFNVEKLRYKTFNALELSRTNQKKFSSPKRCIRAQKTLAWPNNKGNQIYEVIGVTSLKANFFT